uniref:Uncharacterized protein n=1 Tax=Arundo donax TaxID=35708 RepID=A0A0A9AU39_ARUDO
MFMKTEEFLGMS